MKLSAAPLTGLAIGDALGIPFDACSPSSPRLLDWNGTYVVAEQYRLGPGQWTQVTQTSLVLAQNLRQNRAYIPLDVSADYLSWYLSGNFRCIDRTMFRAMENLRAGHSYRGSGVRGSESNSAATRAAPIGMLFSRDLDVASPIASDDALITHRSFEAQEGAKAVAVAIAFLVSGGEKVDVLEEVLDRLSRSSKLRRQLKQCHLKPVRKVSSNVIDTIASAFHAFLTTDHFIDAVFKAVRFGGKTNTVAAVTGALAGAYYGYHNIPTYFLENLEKVWEIRNLEVNLLAGPKVRAAV